MGGNGKGVAMRVMVLVGFWMVLGKFLMLFGRFFEGFWQVFGCFWIVLGIPRAPSIPSKKVETGVFLGGFSFLEGIWSPRGKVSIVYSPSVGKSG